MVLIRGWWYDLFWRVTLWFSFGGSHHDDSVRRNTSWFPLEKHIVVACCGGSRCDAFWRTTACLAIGDEQ